MKKFKFRLQSVLEKRQKELEDKQLEMSKVQARKKEQEDLLNSYNSKRNSTISSLDNLLGATGTVDIDTVHNHQNFIDKLGDDIQLQLKVIADIEIELDMAQKEVQEALKAKMMLEKLKEKQHQEFLKEFEALQAKELDDITSARFRLDKGKQVN